MSEDKVRIFTKKSTLNTSNEKYTSILGVTLTPEQVTELVNSMPAKGNVEISIFTKPVESKYDDGTFLSSFLLVGEAFVAEKGFVPKGGNKAIKSGADRLRNNIRG